MLVTGKWRTASCLVGSWSQIAPMKLTGALQYDLSQVLR